MRVCLISEDSYPFTLGGVGQWTYYLVSTLREVDFTIASITPSPRSRAIYSITPNISGIEQIPLNPNRWNNPAPRDLSPRSQILPIYRKIIKETFEPKGFSDGAGIGEALERLLDPDIQGSKGICRLLERLYMEYYSEKTFRIFYFLTEPLLRYLKRIYEALTLIPEADLYHALNTGCAGLLGLLLSQVRRRPLLVTEHGLLLRERRYELESMDLPLWCKEVILKFFHSISSHVYRYADEVTTVCEYNRHAMMEEYRCSRPIQVIRNAVDTEIYRPWNGVGQGEIVGTVARLVPSKGIHHLIRAAKIVCDRRPNAKFVVIASIQDQEYLKYCKALLEEIDLEGRFSIVPSEDPAEWYPRFSVYVQPSLMEASPLSVLEAMSSGVPVVCTRVGGLSEMVDGYGRLIPPGDIQGLAEGICDLLGDPRRTELGLRSRSHVLEFHSLPSFTEEYRRLYYSLLRG